MSRTLSLPLLAAAALLFWDAPARAQDVPDPSRCRVHERPLPDTRPARRHARDSVEAAWYSATRDTLRAGIAEAARQAGVGEPAGLLIVEYRNRRRGQATAIPFQANVPQAALQAVVDRHSALLAGYPDRSGAFHLRLNPVPLPEGADSTRVMECEPRVLEVERLQRELQMLVAHARPLPAGSNPRVAVHVRMLVTREGEVAYAALARRGFQAGLDERVLGTARRARFLPALVNGAPVDVWVELPFQLVLPVERPRSGGPR